MKSAILAICLLSLITFTNTANLMPWVNPCRVINCACVPAGISNAVNIVCPNPLVNQCYANLGMCGPQRNGQCGWDFTYIPLRNCLNQAGICRATGCGNTRCEVNVGIPVQTPCVFSQYFKCYSLSQCGLQMNGQCAWTSNYNFIDCLNYFNVQRPTFFN